MSFGTNDMQTTCSNNDVMLLLPFGLRGSNFGLFLRIREFFILTDFDDLRFRITTKHNVGTTTRHIGSNCDHAGATSLRDDMGFAFMLLGIQNLMLQLGFGQYVGNQFRVFNRSRAHQHWLSTFLTFLNIFNHRLIFLIGCAVDLIHLVHTLHRPMGWNHDGFQTVNLIEFVSFGIRRAGHAR